MPWSRRSRRRWRHHHRRPPSIVIRDSPRAGTWPAIASSMSRRPVPRGTRWVSLTSEQMRPVGSGSRFAIPAIVPPRPRGCAIVSP